MTTARVSRFMTYAERSAPVLPSADAFRLSLCFAFVMFLSLFAQDTFVPSGRYYTLFLVFMSRGVFRFPFPPARRGGIGSSFFFIGWFKVFESARNLLKSGDVVRMAEPRTG